MADSSEKNEGSLDDFQALLTEWQNTWGRPVLDQIYLGQIENARELLAVAKSNLNQSTLPRDVSEALAYYLVYTTCRLEWDDETLDNYTKASYDSVIAQLSIPAQTTFGDYTRRAYLLTFRCHGTADSYDGLTREDVDELLAPLPDNIAEASWQQVARWAFERHELSLLERAFERTLVNPNVYMGQARWQRVNMMYQLLLGKATRRDVVETIKTFEVRPQVIEFHKIIWPECIKAGLTDPGLEKLLADKEAEVYTKEKGPGLERKTKSYLGKGENL